MTCIIRKINRIFNRNKSKKTYPIIVNPSYMDHIYGAGIVFMNEYHILTGLQTKYCKRKIFDIITGLGGKKEGNETVIETGIREILEELFEFQNNQITPNLILKLYLGIVPKKCINVNGYVMIICDFDDLLFILKEVHILKSPLYDTMPLTIWDLIIKRKINVNMIKQEICQLCLLPVNTNLNNWKNEYMLKDFINDMAFII